MKKTKQKPEFGAENLTKPEIKAEIDANKHLIEGAESIIKNMETPAFFLSFLCDTISWVDSSRRINKRYPDSVDSWFMCFMIEEVVQPWFAGGKDTVKKMAEGLSKISDYFGTDQCFTNMAIITEAFGSYLNGLYPSADFFKRCVSGIKTLGEVCNSLCDYEQEIKKENALEVA